MDTTMTDAHDTRDASFMLDPEFDELSSNGQAAHLERWQEEYDDESKLQGPLTLSLGVEIECILLQNMSADPSQASSPEEASRGQEKVHEGLGRAMYIGCEQCGGKHEYTLRLNSLMKDADESKQGGRYHAWSVGKDTLEMGLRDEFPEQFRNIRIHYIEIRSRILHVAGGMQAEDRGAVCPHRPHVTYRDEIRAIYDRLHEEFLTPSAGDPVRNAWRVLNNKSCGLHIHVGNGGPERRLPLATVKNVVNLYLAAEHAIDPMHSSTRITGSTLLTDATYIPAPASPAEQMFDPFMNVPESAHFLYRAYMTRSRSEGEGKGSDSDVPSSSSSSSLFDNDDEDAKGTDVPAWTRLVARAPTLSKLRALHRPRQKWSTLNIEHLRFAEGDAYPAKQTIEFRQAAGTLDAASALAWVDVVVRLVSYAHEKSVEDVVRMCESEIWSDEKFSTLDFLAEMGFGGRDRWGRKRRGGVGDGHGTFDHYRYTLGLFLDRTANTRHGYAYANRAEEVYHGDLAIAESYGPQDLFYDVMKRNAETTYEETKPEAVHDKTHEKFMRGCYGQFRKCFLRRLGRAQDWRFEGVEEHELKGRLVVGWRMGEEIGLRPLDDEVGAVGDGDDEGQPRPAKRRRGNRVVVDAEESDVDMG